MKRIVTGFTLIALFFLCACTTKNEKENNILTPTPRMTEKELTLTPTTKPTVTVVPSATEAPTETVIPTATVVPSGVVSMTKTAEELHPEEFEKMDWRNLTCFADEKTSLRNSNLLNEGYVTYDDAGNIYFVDMNIGGVFASDKDGKNRRQLSQDTARSLQVEDDWLYYLQEAGIKRINIKTGEDELVYEGACGEFEIVDGKLYVSASGRFYVMEPNGSGRKLLREQKPLLVSYSAGKEFWLGTVAHDTEVSWFMEGYLFGYDVTKDALYYVEKGCWYPLLAGNWMSTFDLDTATRCVRNLETGEETDLGVYAQKAVSNGKQLYYVERYGTNTHIYCWNGTKEEKIMEIAGGNPLDFLYLTPHKLYCLAKVRVDMKTVYQLLYYDLETGETGKVY